MAQMGQLEAQTGHFEAQMGQLVAQMGQLEAQFGSEAQISRLEAHIRYILILASRLPILAFTWVGVASSWPTQPQIKPY